MFTMKEACEKTGLPYETLKFYCNQGLIPNVKRDSRNCRVFSQRDINWINSLNCLKNCNMGIREMKDYLELCLQGPGSIPERQIILEKKRQELVEEVRRLQESIDYIDWKQGFYEDVRSGKTPYVSNLLPEED